MKPYWKLQIDTGGTFSDCIAHDPFGQVLRVKVLSNSSLRGTILQAIQLDCLQVDPHWLGEKNIFEGYTFLLPTENTIHTALVSRWLPEEGLLFLASPLPSLPAAEQAFSLTAMEEAPILAARLLTGTPLQDKLPPMEMRLGTTKGTNALLEGKGASVCLLITEGLQDLLAIGTQARPDIFALNIQRTAPIYQHVIPVSARMNASGEVIQPLEEEDLKKLVLQVLETQCESVAIALLHAYKNPIHEQQIADALEEAGLSTISCSHQMAATIKLLPRAQTTVVNAYLDPLISGYLQAISTHLPHSQLKVMSSAGSLIQADHFLPVDSLLSGPAAGVVGAAKRAKELGVARLLTLDMGGTSTDVARYEEAFEYQYQTEIAGSEVVRPSLAVETVAAGGGSVCWFDGNKLQVGPQSAGADPGPACYGAGGPFTITDVNVLAGRMDPAAMNIPIDVAAAEQAAEQLQARSGLSRQELLAGCLQIANEKMAAAIRSISMRKGYDPTEYHLLAFGGAGGQHACQVAELLGIREVIIPYEAGILSAVGLGLAEQERFAFRSILLPWSLALSQLSDLMAELREEALQAIQQESAHQTPVIRRESLSLRFQGQDHALEIAYSPDSEIMLKEFRHRYETVFGHWIEERELEVAAATVLTAFPAQDSSEIVVGAEKYHPFASHQVSSGIAVYKWEELKAGAFITGNSILTSQFGTVVIEKNWELELLSPHQALLKRAEREERLPDFHPNIQLELFSRRFAAVAEEMGAMLERSSFSVNVKERLDFSCALLDAEAKLVVNAPHIPVHLGSLGVCVRQVLDQLSIGQGDVVITNHPGYGGSHLPDVTLIQAVFSAEGERLAYLVNRAHHAEMGGKRPGSMPPDALNLEEEGVVIPPVYLIHKGIPQWDVIQHLLESAAYPSRSLSENMADLRAGLAALQAGKSQLLQLCHRYGTEQVQRYLHVLRAQSAELLQARLQMASPATYEAHEFLDDGTPLSVKITFEAGKALVDFSGSAGVHPRNLNANPAIVHSVVLYVFRLWLEKSIPLNEGLLEQLTLVIPEGMLNPVFPASPAACPAVVGGNVETSQRLTDLLLKALGMAACSQGTMNNLLFGNPTFGYYETIGGGTGAGPGFAGADAVHQHMTNTRITDPEILEFRYPVRLEEFSIRTGSGGQGTWQGGEGIIRQLRFLSEVELTFLSQHRIQQPYGLAGGEAASLGEQWIIRANGEWESFGGLDSCLMKPGDAIRILTPGGGGYGKK